MHDLYQQARQGGVFDKDAAWESTCLRHLLTTLGIGRKAVKATTDSIGTFVEFRSKFPRFPYYVKALRIPHPDELFTSLMDFQVTGTRRMYRFFRSRFYEEFSSLVEEAQAVGSVKHPALVFYHPQYQSIVMHTWNYDRGAGVRLLVREDADDAPLIVVEPFRQWVHNLLESRQWDFAADLDSDRG